MPAGGSVGSKLKFSICDYPERKSVFGLLQRLFDLPFNGVELHAERPAIFGSKLVQVCRLVRQRNFSASAEILDPELLKALDTGGLWQLRLEFQKG